MVWKRGYVKRAVFALLPLFSLLLGAELVLRCLYYQRYGATEFAIQEYYYCLIDSRAKGTALKKVAEQTPLKTKAISPRKVTEKLTKALYTTEAGKKLLEQFKTKYTKHFKKLLNEVKSCSSRLMLLYIPSEDYSGTNNYRKKECREFFRNLAKEADVTLVDATDELARHHIEETTLLPTNYHLSRFGNRVIASELAEALKLYTFQNEPISYKSRPERLGDLQQNKNRIMSLVAELPFRIVTNKQGFRRQKDLCFPKRQKRILVLGDSFTFGLHLANHDTYPAMLEARLKNTEVINAGIIGYTITQQLRLFRERAKYTEPDLTILQVLDNDLYGLFYFMRNVLEHNCPRILPTIEEREFLTGQLGVKWRDCSK